MKAQGFDQLFRAAGGAPSTAGETPVATRCGGGKNRRLAAAPLKNGIGECGVLAINMAPLRGLGQSMIMSFFGHILVRAHDSPFGVNESVAERTLLRRTPNTGLSVKVMPAEPGTVQSIPGARIVQRSQSHGKRRERSTLDFPFSAAHVFFHVRRDVIEIKGLVDPASEKQNRGMVHVAINIHPSGVWSYTFRTSPVLRLQTR